MRKPFAPEEKWNRKAETGIEIEEVENLTTGERINMLMLVA